jgi:hypothetical protein
VRGGLRSGFRLCQSFLWPVIFLVDLHCARIVAFRSRGRCTGHRTPDPDLAGPAREFSCSGFSRVDSFIDFFSIGFLPPSVPGPLVLHRTSVSSARIWHRDSHGQSRVKFGAFC